MTQKRIVDENEYKKTENDLRPVQNACSDSGPVSVCSIRQVAPLLYGPSWQTPLADALHLSLRTVQRWAAGTHEPSPEHWTAIHDLLDERQRDIAEVVEKRG